MTWSEIYTAIKSKSIDLTALVISMAALFTSCSNQKYVEAAYANNQKIIDYSKKILKKTQCKFKP
ncbi:hypothetical protein [Xenorhabdus griffiniae]|uniref:Uncharacterized protein n=1 Tax=Xenorhabdus griffiniae TaxID=351672 RepID=A0ABY9XKG5_9GAMM|nr:hypothetical protein [Xenorhabdus griffiniae]MBD1229382.1 hypothetical protein [Xenorhabdus griffiniae]MBE8589075.1 hypothetical protein [Xenorhabdus griffiniae]WMV73432.1 hypothetical protein QL128_05215 [Xenorhabdus griffiniae]WNH03111.1 hypothetical protein QL112_005220 [Xenorhabdus griffiniae]